MAVTYQGLLTSFILLFFFSITSSRISDLRLCGDPKCEEPVSIGRTRIRYLSDHPRVLSFSPNVEVKIFSKSAGNRKELWGGEINGKKGYFPHTFVREDKILKKDLEYLVTTDDNLLTQRETTKEDKSIDVGGAGITNESSNINSDKESFPSEIENIKSPVPEKVTDGTSNFTENTPSEVVSTTSPFTKKSSDFDGHLADVKQSDIEKPFSNVNELSYNGKDDNVQSATKLVTQDVVESTDNRWESISTEEGASSTSESFSSEEATTYQSDISSKLTSVSAVESGNKNTYSLLQDAWDSVLDSKFLTKPWESLQTVASVGEQIPLSLHKLTTSIIQRFAASAQTVSSSDFPSKSFEVIEGTTFPIDDDTVDEKADPLSKSIEKKQSESHLIASSTLTASVPVPTVPAAPFQTTQSSDADKEKDELLSSISSSVDQLPVTDSTPTLQKSSSETKELKTETFNSHTSETLKQSQQTLETSVEMSKDSDQHNSEVGTDYNWEHILNKETEESKEEKEHVQPSASEKDPVLSELSSSQATPPISAKETEVLTITSNMETLDINPTATQSEMQSSEEDESFFSHIGRTLFGTDAEDEEKLSTEASAEQKDYSFAWMGREGSEGIPKSEWSEEEEDDEGFEDGDDIEDYSEAEDGNAELNYSSYSDEERKTPDIYDSDKLSQDSTEITQEPQLDIQQSVDISSSQQSSLSPTTVDDVETLTSEKLMSEISTEDVLISSSLSGSPSLTEERKETQSTTEIHTRSLTSKVNSNLLSDSFESVQIDASTTGETDEKIEVTVSVPSETVTIAQDSVTFVSESVEKIQDTVTVASETVQKVQNVISEMTDKEQMTTESSYDEPTTEEPFVDKSAQESLVESTKKFPDPETIIDSSKVLIDESVATSVPSYVANINENLEPETTDKSVELPDVDLHSSEEQKSEDVIDAVIEPPFDLHDAVSQVSSESEPEIPAKEEIDWIQFLTEFDIKSTAKPYIELLRPVIQFIIDLLPSSMRIALEDFETQGLSPRVVVFTIISGIFLLMFLSSYYFIKRGSQEGDLRMKLCKLDKKLYEASTERDVLKEDLKNSQDKVSQLEQNLSKAKEAIEVLDSQLVKSQNECGKLQGEIVSLEEQLETATEAGLELNRMLTDFLTSQNEGRQLQDSVVQLQEQVDCQKTTVTDLHCNLENKNKQNTILKRETEELHSRLQQMEIDFDKLNSDLRFEKDNCEDARQEITTLQNKVTSLESSNSQLLEEAQIWNQRVQAYLKSNQELQESLSVKEGEVEILKDCIQKLKLMSDETSDDNTEASQNLERLMDVSRVSTELRAVLDEKNSLIQHLQSETEKCKSLEEHVAELMVENKQIKDSYSSLQLERDDAQTKLQVLSNYFKEKEMELQKELGMQEAMRKQTQDSALTVSQRAALYEQEIALYKSQVETLKKEIESQERSFKTQIGQHEKKAHDNWLSARAAERKADEAKQEAGLLRNKLTLLEQEKDNRQQNDNVIKPTPTRYAGSNGEVTSSPHLGADSVDFPASGPPSLLREPLDSPRGPPFLPLNRPLPPPPPFLRPGGILPPPPPMPPFGIPGPMPPSHFDLRRMPPPNRMLDRRMTPPPDHQSGAMRRSPPFDTRTAPHRDYRSPPPSERRHHSPPPFDRRPPLGRRISPPMRPPLDHHYSPPPYEHDYRERRASPPKFYDMPPSGQHLRGPPIGAVPPAMRPTSQVRREPYPSDGRGGAGEPQTSSPVSTNSSYQAEHQDEKTTAV